LENAINTVYEGLKKSGAKIYEYEGVNFIAIKNTCGKSNLVVTFGDENMTMEFATQAARFAYGDEKSLVAHVEKYLGGELCAAEFFFNGQALFGGSRAVPERDFQTTSEVAFWYACGNAEVGANVDAFLKKQEVVLACSFWNEKPDLLFKSSSDGKMKKLEAAAD